MVYEKVMHLGKISAQSRNLDILNKIHGILGLACTLNSLKVLTFIIRSPIFQQGSHSLAKSQIYHSIPLI